MPPDHERSGAGIRFPASLFSTPQRTRASSISNHTCVTMQISSGRLWNSQVDFTTRLFSPASTLCAIWTPAFIYHSLSLLKETTSPKKGQSEGSLSGLPQPEFLLKASVYLGPITCKKKKKKTPRDNQTTAVKSSSRES